MCITEVALPSVSAAGELDAWLLDVHWESKFDKLFFHGVFVMVAPTVPVSAKENLTDPIDIQVDVIHLEPIVAVAFPAAAIMGTQAQHGKAIRGIQEHLLGRAHYSFLEDMKRIFKDSIQELSDGDFEFKVTPLWFAERHGSVFMDLMIWCGNITLDKVCDWPHDLTVKAFDVDPPRQSYQDRHLLRIPTKIARSSFPDIENIDATEKVMLRSILIEDSSRMNYTTHDLEFGAVGVYL
ncbi:hypothetical protein Tco_0726915 [Tanacetum coccineum]|uniref:Uncharacterized protein n=1 Tax=Tanacetum coccineum TaxID=301880 RepID=A0ABQ4YGX2_9ASTR